MRFKFLTIFFIIIVFIEILFHFIPLYKFEELETFLINSINQKIEKGGNNYDVLIIGDSRSMSISPTNDSNLSYYNFSLPKINNRYYRYFIQKYIKYNSKPKAIILAISPKLISLEPSKPLIDPTLEAFAESDMDLIEYLESRILMGLKNPFGVINNNDQAISEFSWDFFSQRYTHLFSAIEFTEQYKGPERIFIVSKTLPLYLHTIKYRKAIKQLFQSKNFSNSRELSAKEISDCCNCEELAINPICNFKNLPNYWKNVNLEKYLILNHGGYNISNLIEQTKIYMYQELQDQFIEERKKEVRNFNDNPTLNFTEFNKLVSYLESENIQMFYINVPTPKYYNTQFFTRFYSALKKETQYINNFHILKLDNEFMNEKYFSDQIHLSCDGSQILNSEINEKTIPLINSILMKK